MISNTQTWLSAYRERADLDCYPAKLGIFALQVRYQIDDIHTVLDDNISIRSETISVTDCPKDKKYDLVYLEREARRLVVIQDYEATGKNLRDGAKANKAADMNTAASWLFSCDEDKIPEEIKQVTLEARELLRERSIDVIEFWLVHNCPETDVVKQEIHAVYHSVCNAIKNRDLYPQGGDDILVKALEVGRETLEEWYLSLTRTILVTEKIETPDCQGAYKLCSSTGGWDAVIATLPLSWLHNLYGKYGDNLFSANVRDYLGSRKGKNNINSGIKETAEQAPENFWVFNNGVTALVIECDLEDGDVSGETLSVVGISIINGAQTTGAIGNLKTAPKGFVQIRFIKCKSDKTIEKIVEFNNRQNEVKASDFRSNDSIQKRLRSEFESEYPRYTYTGGRRGGNGDKILRPGSNSLAPDTVAQSLAAFHGDPITAYNIKSDIWENDEVYSKCFDRELITARHIIFVYALHQAILKRKQAIKNLSERTSQQEKQLSFLEKKGSTYLLTYSISVSLELILSKTISADKKFLLSFEKSIDIQSGIELWEKILDVVLPQAQALKVALQPRFSSDRKAQEVTENMINNLESVLEGTDRTNAKFQDFSSHVQILEPPILS